MIHPNTLSSYHRDTPETLKVWSGTASFAFWVAVVGWIFWLGPARTAVDHGRAGKVSCVDGSRVLKGLILGTRWMEEFWKSFSFGKVAVVRFHGHYCLDGSCLLALGRYMIQFHLCKLPVVSLCRGQLSDTRYSFVFLTFEPNCFADLARIKTVYQYQFSSFNYN